MGFFNKNKKTTSNDTFYVKEIMVATATIISDYYDGSDVGPRSKVKWYFAVREMDGKYYELFSNVQIEKKSDSSQGFRFSSFNRPYIEKVEPLTKYLDDPNSDEINSQTLFNFILYLNVQEQLRTSSKMKN